MTSKNSTSPKSSNQEKEIGHIKYSYEESFKRENISLLDDSVLIKNYNDSLKSPEIRGITTYICQSVQSRAVLFRV